MPICFFDTSALVKHYHVEVGTPRVDHLLAGAGSDNVISGLGVVEFHSVFAREVRNAHITAAEFLLFRGRFQADLAAGLFRVIPTSQTHFTEAEQLILRQGMTRGMRTLDALQLAVALEMHAGSGLDHFVSADRGLCGIAATEGLGVINPEIP